MSRRLAVFTCNVIAKLQGGVYPIVLSLPFPKK
jgi:hypothetical protein